MLAERVMTATATPAAGLNLHSAMGRIALAATVGASGMASLDATVVNVALPHIGADFGASVSALQWVLTGYLLALASLILLGGALGDRFGRRRVFVIGTVWFAAASLLCGAAPNIEVLVGARVLQGVGAALLTPGSLAIIQASFRAGRPGRGSGRVVGTRRGRRRDRPVPRGLVGRRPGLALGVPHQRSRCRARHRLHARGRARNRAIRMRRGVSISSAPAIAVVDPGRGDLGADGSRPARLDRRPR